MERLLDDPSPVVRQAVVAEVKAAGTAGILWLEAFVRPAQEAAVTLVTRLHAPGGPAVERAGGSIEVSGENGRENRAESLGTQVHLPVLQSKPTPGHCDIAWETSPSRKDASSCFEQTELVNADRRAIRWLKRRLGSYARTRIGRTCAPPPSAVSSW